MPRRPRAVRGSGAALALVAAGLVVAVFDWGAVRADEALPTPFVGPSGELRLVVRPEFRSPAAILEDMKPFHVEGLQVDLVGPTVAGTPPSVPLPPAPTWSRVRPNPAPPPPKPPPPPEASRLLLRGSPEAVARGREVLHYLDVPRPSVLVSLLVVETRCVGQTESGGSVTFDRSPGGPDPAGTLFQGFAADFEPDAFLRAGLTGARPFEGTSVTLGDGAYEQVLRMLVRRNEAEFLAWPTLLVTEGEPGSVSSMVVLPQALVQRTNDVRVVRPVAEETGIRLDVVAVSVGLEEALLEVVAWLRVAEPASGADTAPGSLVLRTRQVRTRVSVRDRASVWIGGIRLRRQLGARRGLPGLDRLPALDPLASARRRETEESDVVLLLRARILWPGRSRPAFAPPSETERLQDLGRR